MKKGLDYIGIVERVDFPNKGFVRVIPDCEENAADAEIRVTIKGVIEGQKVKFRLTKLHVSSQKGEGRLLEVITPAPQEVEAPCGLFGTCGGCAYQSLPYEAQLALKEEQIRRLMDAVITEPYEFMPIRRSPQPLHYRNKMEFSFGNEYKDGPLSLGLHKKGSFYDVLTTDACQIVHEDYNLILREVLSLCKETGLAHFHKITHKGYFRHLVVRRGLKTGEILVNLVTSSDTETYIGGQSEAADGGCVDGDGVGTEAQFATDAMISVEAEKKSFDEEAFLKNLCDRLLALPIEGKFAGIIHSRNNSLADVVISEKTTVLYGKDHFYEELLGLKFRITPFSFFQTNSLGAEVLYSTAREFIGEVDGKLVFDLYSGTGTIAQMVASVARKVIGVEIIEEAVEAAKENAAGNGLSNCEFIAGDVLKMLDTIEERPDMIILDPPRDGINPKALDKIINYGVDHLVYISCKPTSLQRDLVTLQERGYRVVKVCPVDEFPMTAHTETCVLLTKRS
ncbi:MAG: class I SAM-dependent RNA methyltransferase [Lachnospiraceae bacterium]|nr:class I SAM-dependent RNA methyltransferase [Lachnospiraceae bacterium]